MKASSRATCTDSQLPIMIVKKRRRPSAEMVRSSGPIEMVVMICSWTVKISGKAARAKGRATTAPRDRRNGPRPAVAEQATSVSQMIAIARNEPIGSSEITRIPAIVRMNLTRASARWNGLLPST